MNALKQAAWLVSVLIALACSRFYFASLKPVERLNDSVLSKTADMVVSNLVVRRFDEKGKLVNFLQAPEMQHVPDNNTFYFSSPRMSLNQTDQPAWEISSKKAKALNGGEKITFINDVVIHQDKNTKGQESTIKTELLHYFSKTRIAMTKAAVSFEQPGSIVHSKGMKAYLDEKRVQLNHAHATFEPKHA
ncbi:MAG: LPS export ABC transporter periplasmic protein LptC [Tatlockia sp.]|nr:LPS export ABC transporter periplasmic protein LptC [Tatlockia sp.]